jgi:hypothetical protein
MFFIVQSLLEIELYAIVQIEKVNNFSIKNLKYIN